jgi:hypothetical protein
MPEEPQSHNNPPAFIPPVSPTPPPQPATTPIAPSPQQAVQPIAAPTTPESSVASPATETAWISKEEYQRLQQAEVAQQVTAMAKPEKIFGTLPIITSTLAALALLAGLLAANSNFSYFSSFFITPSLIVLTLTGAFAWYDYVQASKAGGYVKRHKARNVVMLICSILLIAMPILLPAIMIVIFMIVCATGGCKGS